MHILISNDDGYLAQGINTLAQALSHYAEISVVAPDKNRSAASNSLTLDMPLRATACDNGFVRVDGTPTDCVHLAITGLLKSEPDMVFAGINHGANLGDDVLYSGTVAAATEGRFLGLPAVAISLASADPKHFETAAQVAVELMQKILAHPLPEDTLLNVNVPDVPLQQLKGYQPRAWANGIKPKRWFAPAIRAGIPFTGWARRGASRMPVRAPTSMRSGTVLYR